MIGGGQRGLRVALGLTLGLLVSACTGGAEAERLATASTSIVFDSMDALGPHHALSSLRQTMTRSDGTVEKVDDAVEIKWQSWDLFEHRRVADGRLSSAVRVVDGVPYVARAGADDAWERRSDADMYRGELRAAWSQWDLAMGPFADRVELRDAGEELIEGRPVRRYTVHLAPAPPAPEAAKPPAGEPRTGKGKAKRKAGSAKPATTVDPLRSLSGSLWVDAATAVRLVAEIEGERLHRDKTLQFTYNLAVSAIGQDQAINVPIHIEPSPSPLAGPPPDPADADGTRPAPRDRRPPRRR